MKLIYPAIFHKEDEQFWVEFPDLEGCQSFGNNLTEALDFAREALEGYCIALLEAKRPLPPVSDIKSLETDEDSFVSLVETNLTTNLSKQKSVKKTLTLPAWLNDMALEKGINFSAVLQEALVDRLGL